MQLLTCEILTLCMNPMVAAATQHHFAVIIIIVIALITQWAEVPCERRLKFIKTNKILLTFKCCCIFLLLLVILISHLLSYLLTFSKKFGTIVTHGEIM